jgi:S1-C subfamily serine protease
MASPPAFAIDAVDRAIVLVNVTYRTATGRPARGSGSGIIVDAAGFILTAEHVVSRAATVAIQLRTGETLPADVVGTDRVYDVALLHVEAQRPLPTASLGLAASLQRGNTVVALGRAPHRQTGPTAGVFLETDIETRAGTPTLVSTAVVYPGDSGGALVNERGEVVGLIVAITRNGLISLSLATDAVRVIVTDLRAGDVRHPWLGITGRTLSEDVAVDRGLAVRSGVIILEVLPRSPASLAGLRAPRPGGAVDFPTDGDVITAIDGRPVPTFGTLAAYILTKHIGDAVTLDINRDGHLLTMTVVLGERPTL